MPPQTAIHGLSLLLLLIHLTCCAGSAEPPSKSAAPPPASAGPIFDFERDEAGKAPAGFTPGLAGGGGPVNWQVQMADDAPSGKQVVAQLSEDKTNKRFPVLIRDDILARDVDLSVRFKTISGKVDASGGLILRCKDDQNYYVVRANTLEENVVAYKVVAGQRSNLGVRGQGKAYGVDAQVPHGKWNVLRVIAKERVMEVYLNGRKLFEAEDGTFTDAGKTGLWTKADAVTQFDDLHVQSLDRDE